MNSRLREPIHHLRDIPKTLYKYTSFDRPQQKNHLCQHARGHNILFSAFLPVIVAEKSDRTRESRGPLEDARTLSVPHRREKRRYEQKLILMIADPTLPFKSRFYLITLYKLGPPGSWRSARHARAIYKSWVALHGYLSNEFPIEWRHMSSGGRVKLLLNIF